MAACIERDQIFFMSGSGALNIPKAMENHLNRVPSAASFQADEVILHMVKVFEDQTSPPTDTSERVLRLPYPQVEIFRQAIRKSLDKCSTAGNADAIVH
jgi:hypothetical protein